MKIAYIGGHWSTNIGNSFYNLGAMHLLEEVCKKESVYFVPDPPQELWIGLKGNYDLISNLDADVFIITGPSLGASFKTVYQQTFDLLKKRGKKIALLSIGAVDYTEEEADQVADFLKNYDLLFACTRDTKTYELYKDRLNTEMYDGLCTSMFLNDAVNVVDNIDDYVVFNFSFRHEPFIEEEGGAYHWKKKLRFKFQESFKDKKIVRPNNVGLFRNHRRIFNRKNIYFSDLPEGYLSIFKNADIVFSDRVHSCCATLILGGRAMYIKSSSRASDGRNNLFYRLNVGNIYQEPVTLDMDYIEKEKSKMKEFLKEVIPV